MARSYRDPAPLETAAAELERLVAASLPRNRRRRAGRAARTAAAPPR